MNMFSIYLFLAGGTQNYVETRETSLTIWLNSLRMSIQNLQQLPSRPDLILDSKFSVGAEENPTV